MSNLGRIASKGSGAYLSGRLYREWRAKVKRHDKLEKALKRIAAGESEVPALAHEFYGHAIAIATKALAETETEETK